MLKFCSLANNYIHFIYPYKFKFILLLKIYDVINDVQDHVIAILNTTTPYTRIHTYILYSIKTYI